MEKITNELMKQKRDELELMKKYFLDDVFSSVNIKIKLTLVRLTIPAEFAGDDLAARIISAIKEEQFTPAGVKRRVERSFYSKDIHFYNNGGKMRRWNREALINQELKEIKEKRL